MRIFYLFINLFIYCSSFYVEQASPEVFTGLAVHAFLVPAWRMYLHA